MSGDPYSHKPPDPWVTSSPGHSRSVDPGPDNIAVPPPMLARGAQWGLAALFLGAPLLAGAPVLLLLLRSFWTLGPAGMRVPVAFAAGLGGTAGAGNCANAFDARMNGNPTPAIKARRTNLNVFSAFLIISFSIGLVRFRQAY